jgi:hypothetical protein
MVSMTFTKRQLLQMSVSIGATAMTGKGAASAATALPGAGKPPMVGVRFDAAGEAPPMRGNTIVCPLPPADAVTQQMVQLHGALKESIAARCLALLPPSSLHMTLINGALDTDRARQNWPSSLPTDAPLTSCDRLFTEKMQVFDLGCDLPFRMRISEQQDGLADPNAVILYLEPADAAEERKIRHLRDRIADAWQLYHPGHATFRFHSTQAYVINWPTHDELAAAQALILTSYNRMRQAGTILELNQAAFCFFDDMLEFRPRVPLQRR